MDTLTPGERSIRMGLIRPRDTKPEMAVRGLVHRMGYRYRLHLQELPGTPDLVFRAKLKVIFVNGCFWHLHQNCAKCRLPKSNQNYWNLKLEDNAKRDRRDRRRLRYLGWRSLVVWQCELDDLDHLSRKLRKFLSAT